MRGLNIIFYLLKSNSKVTMSELAAHFNVSTKTIQRDLDKLSVSGIPIISHRGKDGGVQIDRNYEITRLMLRYKDFDKLIFSLYVAENISDYIRQASLIDRFKIIDYDRASEILKKCEQRFIVDKFEEKFNLKSDICRQIDEAIDNKCFIEVTVNERTIEVFPISYVLKSEGLCLYCYNKKYLLILINDIYKVKNINKSYNGNIISYMENKENLYIENI